MYHEIKTIKVFGANVSLEKANDGRPNPFVVVSDIGGAIFRETRHPRLTDGLLAWQDECNRIRNHPAAVKK